MKIDTQFSKVEIMVDSQTLTLSEDEFYDAVEKCVEISENFAIGFSEWCNRNYGLDRTTWVKYVDGKFNRYTTKELLEIYKKTL